MAMNRRGFYPLFTTLGLLLVLMVLAMTIQWSSTGDKEYAAHIDRLSWLRINNAAKNVESMVSSSLRELYYDAIAKVGGIPKGKTINPFLDYEKEEGWAKIVENISESVSSGFNDIIPDLADWSDGTQSIFAFDNGINITVGQLSAKDLDITDMGSEAVAVVKMPMFVTNMYEGWETTMFESNVTIPLNVRLRDMYERAWEFNKNYGDYVSWTFTGALYARAYLNAYTQGDGPLLKEAHYEFDPIATLLFGDIDTFNAFAGDMGSVLDVGAIPAATWLAEWQFLSEPSFLPAGSDMTGADAEKAQGAIQNNYRMGEIENEVCADAVDKESCRAVYDISELKERVDYLARESDKYDEIKNELESWLDDYDTTTYEACEYLCENILAKCLKKCKRGKAGRACRDKCEEKDDECFYENKEDLCRERALDALFGDGNNCDEFRDDASAAIDDALLALEKLDERGCLSAVRKPQDDYVEDADIDSRVKDELQENETYGLDKIPDYCTGAEKYLSDLASVQKTSLSTRSIGDSKCKARKSADCRADGACEDEDCEASCKYPSCPSDGSSYDCLDDMETGFIRTGTCNVCHDGDCHRKSLSVDQCTCRCRPSIELLMRINNDFKRLLIYVNKTAVAVEETHDNMREQLSRRENADRLAKAAAGLGEEKLGYDVFSRIDTAVVKYDKGEVMGGKYCYYDPDFTVRDNGTCGDSVESGIVYTVQIAAAALATLFSGGAAAPILDYAKDFFPVIFETGAEFNITETLIDDGNRVMLANIGGQGAELYTYAPLQFEIYKDKHFSAGSKTLDRLFVYIYLPSVKGRLERVINAITDKSCRGDKC